MLNCSYVLETDCIEDKAAKTRTDEAFIGEISPLFQSEIILQWWTTSFRCDQNLSFNNELNRIGAITRNGNLPFKIYLNGGVEKLNARKLHTKHMMMKCNEYK